MQRKNILKIEGKERHKIVFIVSFGRYKWNVISFELKKNTFKISKNNERNIQSILTIYNYLYR